MSWREEIQHRCSRFAAVMLQLLVRLPKRPVEKYLSDQLMRSSTSIGANLSEAQSAESRADFIHKMQIALKEAKESCYWLDVLSASGICNDTTVDRLLKECQEIAAILAQSVVTAKANRIREETNNDSSKNGKAKYK